MTAVDTAFDLFDLDRAPAVLVLEDGRTFRGDAYGATGETVRRYGQPIGFATADIAVGDHVRHREFGEGTVVQVRESGDEQEITVAFPGAGMRRLLARYAGLEKVGT